MPSTIRITAVCLILAGIDANASAQQTMVRTTTPFQSNGDRFYENFGVGWSVRRGPNFFATFGGPTVAAPKFGGFNPNAGISSGWSVRNGDWSTNFNFNFSQGYERFSSTVAPTVMSLDGQPAYFFSGVQRPYVRSLVPIVPGGGGGFFSVPPGSIPQRRVVTTPESNIASMKQRLEQARREARARDAREQERDGADRVERPKTTVDPKTRRSRGAFRFFGSGK